MLTLLAQGLQLAIPNGRVDRLQGGQTCQFFFGISRKTTLSLGHALGKAALSVRSGLIGAVAMPAAFWFGLRWGISGLAWAWLAGMAVLLAATILISLPAIGAGRRALARAILPGLAASSAMAAAVKGLDLLLPAFEPAERLALLVPFGAAVYAALLFLFARSLVEEMVALLRPQRVVVQGA